MNRGTKKFLYGLFYFSCVALIAFLIYQSYTKTPLTCFDNIQNQNETGVDCGGSCISCELKNLIPLDEIGTAQVFTIPSFDKEIVLFKVENQNTAYHAMQFTYVVNVLDKNDIVVETVSGTDSLFAGEQHYIFESRLTTPIRNIGHISLELNNPQWKSVNEFVPPALTLSGIATDVGKSWLRVNGSIKNGNTFSAQNVKILAILHGKSGMRLFASQVILTSLPGFTTQSFTIPFPFDKTLIDGLSASSTEVFVSSQ